MLLAIVISYVLLGRSSAENHPNITMAQFAGTIAMFAVPRGKVQGKLDKFNSQIPNPEKRLTLPNMHILPGFIRSDQHVVSVSSGILTARSFEESLPTSVADLYTLRTPTVQFYIPFLSGDDPNDLPVYTLSLDSFISTDKPFVQPNIVLPTEQVESIVWMGHGISIKDGDEYLTVSWEEEETCESLNRLVATDINHFIDDYLLPFDHVVRFALCGGSDVDLQEIDLCKARDAVSSDLARNRFDACQSWSLGQAGDEFEKCQLKSYRIESISEKFANISLLSMDNPVPVFSDIQPESYVNIGIKFPCIE